MTTYEPTDGPTGELPNEDAARKRWHQGVGISGDALIGQTIGHYRIRSVIASGGMGTVFEAVQESPRRIVALKVVKHGIASRSALRRFEYESQILARLRHPGIAQVYEAGTHDDNAGAVPYFAMEYIPNARPITDYVREKKLSTHERLELFTKVCDAVHHGHQKGIIHRDLKPGNILVDSQGQPKVIDFGVARATDSDLAVTTLQTDVGQLIGTLQYMSPEQCDADPHDIDTRSDVYALGIVLYEMLSEQLPYDVTKVAVYEAARVIREIAPAKLSSFNRRLRGDIETIALKAMEKERDRRYHSAADLGADISRYLSNEPIIARPPSVIYQASTFARRNKALVGGVTAVFVVLIAGLIGVSVMYTHAEAARADAVAAREAEEDQRVRAEQREQEAIVASEAEAEQRRLAEASEQRAIVAAERALAAELEAEQRAEELEKVAEFQASQLSGIDTAMMGVRLRADILDQRRATLEAHGMDHDGINAALEELESSLAGVNFTNIALATLDENIFERALSAIDEQFADQPLLRARLLHTLGATLVDLGMLDRALPLHESAMEIRRRELGDEHADTLAAIHNKGVLMRILGRYEEAYALQLEAVEGRRRELGAEHRDTLAAVNEIGQVLRDMERFDEGIAYMTEALESRRRVLGDDDEDTLRSLNDLGTVLHLKGDLDEAEVYYLAALEGFQRILGEQHPYTLATANNLGVLLNSQRRLEEAATYQRNVWTQLKQSLGDRHPHTLMTGNNLGVTLYYRKQMEEAEVVMREVMTGRRRTLGDNHADTRDAANTLALILFETGRELFSQGQLEEATGYVREALDLAREALGENHHEVTVVTSSLGHVLGEYGRSLRGEQRFEEAATALVESHSLYAHAMGDHHEMTVQSIESVADLYDAWHEHDPYAGHDEVAGIWRAKLPSEADLHGEGDDGAAATGQP